MPLTMEEACTFKKAIFAFQLTKTQRSKTEELSIVAGNMVFSSVIRSSWKVTQNAQELHISGSEGNFTTTTFKRSSTSMSEGAIHARESAVNLTKLGFVGNEAVLEGSVACFDASVNVNAARFNDCKAEDKGGFIFAEERSQIRIRDSFMDRSTSKFGGAISLDKSELFALQIAVSNCSATNEGGAIHGNDRVNFLCTECAFAGKTMRREGDVFVESSETQYFAFQFDKSTFKNDNEGSEVSFESTLAMITVTLRWVTYYYT